MPVDPLALNFGKTNHRKTGNGPTGNAAQNPAPTGEVLTMLRPKTVQESAAIQLDGHARLTIQDQQRPPSQAADVAEHIAGRGRAGSGRD